MTEPIAIIEKSKRSDVRIRLDSWHGKVSLRIREFEVWARLAAGKKGTQNKITLPISRLPEMRRAICQAEAEAIESGLLPDVENYDNDEPGDIDFAESGAAA